MNKKLLALVMIIIVLGTLFAGCTMFTLDENRDYHQVVATVKYGDMRADIYRGDLLTYVLNYGGQYIQNYGMTPEQVVEYFYNNLSKQKLLLLYAKNYVAKKGIGITAVTADADIAKMATKDFLTVDELRYCIEATNKQFDDLWKENISSLEKEQEANKGEQAKPEEEDKKDEDELAARPVRPEEQASTEYEDKHLEDASKLPVKFDEIAADKISTEKDADKKNNMRTALSQLNKSLEKNFHDYDYFLEQQMESRIVAKYQEALGKNEVTISDDEISARYTKLVNTDIAKYVDEKAYAAAVDANTFSLYHTNKGYSRVKSILLKFNTAQEAALNLVKHMESEDFAIKFRNDMALGKVDETTYPEYAAMIKDEDAKKDGSKGVTINVSNPKYDAKKDELATAYTDKNVDLNTILYALANALGASKAKMQAALTASGITDQKMIDAALNYAVKDAFVDWTYLVNDDPGMFENDSYVITRDGAATTYVPEFTVLGRKLAESGVGSYAIDTTAPTSTSSVNIKYEGETELLKGVNGKTATIAVQENVISHLENDEEIKTNIYTLTTTEGNSISFIINDFGIHLILVTDKAFDEIDPAVEEVKEGEEVKGYKLGLEYIYKKEVKVTYKKDAEGKDTEEIEKVKVELKSIKDYVSDLYQKEKESDIATDQQIKLFADESRIEKNEKVYKKIVEKLK